MITLAPPATPPPPSDAESAIASIPPLTLTGPTDDKENEAPSSTDRPKSKRALRKTPHKCTPGRDGTMGGIFTGSRFTAGLSPVPFILPLTAMTTRSHQLFQLRDGRMHV